MKPTKADVVALSSKDVEALLSLMSYHKAAEALFDLSLMALDAMKDASSEKDKQTIFLNVVRQTHDLWIASVYVVHEGFQSLNIQDSKLNKLLAKHDIGLLRRFRNATFHYQRAWKDKRRMEIIMNDLALWIQDIHFRHREILHRMMKHVVSHPDKTTII